MFLLRIYVFMPTFNKISGLYTPAWSTRMRSNLPSSFIISNPALYSSRKNVEVQLDIRLLNILNFDLRDDKKDKCTINDYFLYVWKELTFKKVVCNYIVICQTLGLFILVRKSPLKIVPVAVLIKSRITTVIIRKYSCYTRW